MSQIAMLASAKFASVPVQQPDVDLMAAIGVTPEYAPFAFAALAIAAVKIIF